MANETREEILRALEELRAVLPSVEIDADRIEVSEALNVVESLANNRLDHIDRPTTCDEVLVRFLFTRLDNLRRSDGLPIYDFLNEYYTRAYVMEEIELRMNETRGSSFLERLNWLLALLANEEQMENIVASVRGGLL